MTNERALAPQQRALNPTALTFDQLVDVSDRISKSGIVPKAYRNNAGAVLAASLYGSELGLGPMASLKLIDVIEGTPVMSAQGMLALVRKAGHRVSGSTSATKATVTGYRGEDSMTVEWTIDQAKRAGLAGKAVWQKYPSSMLWARAVSQLCRQMYPDVLIGLTYTADEAYEIEGVDLSDDDNVIDAVAVAVVGEPEPPPADDPPIEEPTPIRAPEVEKPIEELPTDNDGGWELPFGAALTESAVLTSALVQGYVREHSNSAAASVEATLEFLGNMLAGVAAANDLPGPVEAIPTVIGEMEAWAEKIIEREANESS